DQDRPLERARQAEGAVSGPLAGDPQVVLGGEADRRGDVFGALYKGDRLGALVGGEVPGEAHLIPVWVARGGNAAGDRQPGEVTHLDPFLSQLSAKRSTVPPAPTRTALTISGGKRPWAAMPGSASRRAA